MSKFEKIHKNRRARCPHRAVNERYNAGFRRDEDITPYKSRESFVQYDGNFAICSFIVYKLHLVEKSDFSEFFIPVVINLFRRHFYQFINIRLTNWISL